METYIIQILDYEGRVIRCETVDVHELGVDGIVQDAYREFSLQSDQFLKVIGPAGDVVYDDWATPDSPSLEEIENEEYFENLKYYPDDGVVI